MVSQSDTVTMLLVDTQPTTHSRANSRVSPTWKAAVGCGEDSPA